MAAVSVGVMKTAMGRVSPCARLAAAHPLGRMGEIADRAFYQARAGFRDQRNPRYGQRAVRRTPRSLPAIAVEATKEA